MGRAWFCSKSVRVDYFASISFWTQRVCADSGYTFTTSFEVAGQVRLTMQFCSGCRKDVSTLQEKKQRKKAQFFIHRRIFTKTWLKKSVNKFSLLKVLSAGPV